MASSVFAPAVHGVSLAGPTTVTRLRRPPAMRKAAHGLVSMARVGAHAEAPE